MRTRTRTIDTRIQPAKAGYTITNGAVTYYCNGNPATSANAVYGAMPAVTLEGFSERMDDALGKTKVNPCSHRRRSFKVNDAYVEHSGALGATTYGRWPGSPIEWAQLPYRKARLDAQTFDINSKTLAPNRWSISGTINESVLKENCFEKARGLKADVLLNVVEGNQIWPSISSLATALPIIGKNWGRIRKVIRTASGGYLAWKFGVSPILSDIMSINRYLPKLGRDIADARKEKRYRYSAVGKLSATFNSASDNTSSDNGYVTSTVNYQGRILEDPTVRYVLVVEPTRRYETEFFSALDLCMRRFTTSPASLAWELVPFSFVLDWFVDLRGMCRALDQLVGFEPYKTVSLTRSYAYSMATDVSWKRCTPCNGSTLFDIPCGSVDFTHYERIPVSEGPTAPSWKPRFGKNQAGITAALIAQALSRGTRRKP